MHKVEFLFSSGKTLPQKIVCWENLNSKGAVNKVYNIARICVGGNCNSTKMHSDSALLSDVYAVLSGMFVYLCICVFAYLCICVVEAIAISLKFNPILNDIFHFMQMWFICVVNCSLFQMQMHRYASQCTVY